METVRRRRSIRSRESGEPAGWSENTKREAPPPFSLSPSPCFITKILIHVLVLKAKEKQKKTSNMKVTLLALGYRTCLAISRQPRKSSRGIQ